MPERGPGRPRRTAAATAVAAAVALSAALCGLRVTGVAARVGDSPAAGAGVAVAVTLAIAFLLAYLLGSQTGLVPGLVILAALVAALQAANGSFDPIELMVTAAPWTAGRIMRSRRQLAEQLRVRNEELLAQQEAYAAETVRYERSRIAAELHDLVGHALSLMVVQASAAQRAARGDDGAERPRAALELVARAAGEAQAELGALAGLLGDENTASAGGIDLVTALVQQAKAAGVDVTYRLQGEADEADARAGVVARIVTEALTNALKHAPGAPVTVDVRAAAGALDVTIANGPGRGAARGLGLAGGGYGLTSMRDRAAAAGGTLTAGPAGEGGWRVRASLPAPPVSRP